MGRRIANSCLLLLLLFCGFGCDEGGGGATSSRTLSQDLSDLQKLVQETKKAARGAIDPLGPGNDRIVVVKSTENLEADLETALKQVLTRSNWSDAPAFRIQERTDFLIVFFTRGFSSSVTLSCYLGGGKTLMETTEVPLVEIVPGVRAAWRGFYSDPGGLYKNPVFSLLSKGDDWKQKCFGQREVVARSPASMGTLALARVSIY